MQIHLLSVNPRHHHPHHFQTYMDVLEGVGSTRRETQTSQGLCKGLACSGSRIEASLWRRKTRQLTLTCTSWG